MAGSANRLRKLGPATWIERATCHRFGSEAWPHRFLRRVPAAKHLGLYPVAKNNHRAQGLGKRGMESATGLNRRLAGYELSEIWKRSYWLERDAHTPLELALWSLPKS